VVVLTCCTFQVTSKLICEPGILERFGARQQQLRLQLRLSTCDVNTVDVFVSLIMISEVGGECSESKAVRYMEYTLAKKILGTHTHIIHVSVQLCALIACLFDFIMIVIQRADRTAKASSKSQHTTRNTEGTGWCSSRCCTFMLY
jgi:hypothetical protein